MISKLFILIAKSPAIKTIIFCISTIISGVISGIFVYEITSSGKIDWHSFYKVRSFRFILAWLLIVYFYNLFLYRKESNILKFKDDDFCKAYIRSQCLPEIAAKYKDVIKSGDISSLKDLVSEVRRILK